MSHPNPSHDPENVQPEDETDDDKLAADAYIESQLIKHNT